MSNKLNYPTNMDSNISNATVVIQSIFVANIFTRYFNCCSVLIRGGEVKIFDLRKTITILLGDRLTTKNFQVNNNSKLWLNLQDSVSLKIFVEECFLISMNLFGISTKLQS